MSEEEDIILLQALCELTSGTTLLKAGRSGKPHFRRFRLTSDLTRLTWESAKKSDTAVLISQITELKVGQTTPNFKRNPLPEYESRSFSLLYSGRSLDIVCTEKREFEIWTSGLQALMNGFNDHRAVESFLSRQDRRKTMMDERLKVDIGTLKTKVVVKESACDLYTWGSGVRGMLGHKDEDNEILPRVVESLLGRDIVTVACGVHHTIALSVTGEVFSWGSGAYGRLGHGHLRDRFSPLMIGAPLRGMGVTNVACHEFHSAAVCDNGELFTWGRAGPHLGYEVEDSNKQLRPRRVDTLSDHKVIQVACGYTHTLVCTEAGKVFSFGSNKFGELGLGNNDSMVLPRLVNLSSIQKVACGRHHSAAVDVDGYLWMWGWGQRGQLGHGEMKNLSEPSAIELFRLNSAEQVVADIACGDAHNCALTANGIAYCWGDNSAGQLGIAHSYPEVSKPRAVLTPSGQQLIQVACGANFTVALSGAGRVFTWGLNSSGQLAHGDTKSRSQPMEVEALLEKQVRMVACGAEHMACTVVHGWVPDEEAKACMACKKGFTTVRRRHHCRKCGGVYCGNCSAKRFPLLDRGYSDPVRVCDKCFNVLAKDS